MNRTSLLHLLHDTRLEITIMLGPYRITQLQELEFRFENYICLKVPVHCRKLVSLCYDLHLHIEMFALWEVFNNHIGADTGSLETFPGIDTIFNTVATLPSPLTAIIVFRYGLASFLVVTSCQRLGQWLRINKWWWMSRPRDSARKYPVTGFEYCKYPVNISNTGWS